MPLFGRRHHEPAPAAPAGVPGLADAAQGWQPVTGRPFGHDVVDGIHDITRAMYGDSRLLLDTPQRAVGETTFSEAFRARIGGRTVTVANANTYIDPGLFQAGRFSPDVAACAVELATMVPGTIVQPYHVQQFKLWGRTELGHPGLRRPVPDQHRQRRIRPANPYSRGTAAHADARRLGVLAGRVPVRLRGHGQVPQRRRDQLLAMFARVYEANGRD
jgi:hypothetical protein